MKFRLLSILCAALSLSLSAATLEVVGEVTSVLKLKEADLMAMPRTKVTGTEHNGSKVELAGVAVHEILRRAGVPLGEQFRGRAIQLCLLVTASDGYQAVFALPEIDPLFNEHPVILADRRDGQPLDSVTGPLRLVLPGEKSHARWIRQVTRFEIVRVASSLPGVQGTAVK